MVEKADDATEKILAGESRRECRPHHDADCPVWTGVHIEQAAPLEALVQNIVCAVDLKPHSERVLEWAQQMLGEYQAGLHVVHAIPAYETRPASYFDAELRLNLEAEGKGAVQKFLDARGVEATIDVHGGEVAHVIGCVAQRLRADLLIIGRSSDRGLVGRLRAKAYSIIRQSPCPVVSV